MLEVNSKIQKRKTILVNEQKSTVDYTALKQKLIAFACISFFPLLYLIGSTIVKYFG